MTSAFPTGAALDRLVLWTIAELARNDQIVEAWSSVVLFYALRECDLLEFCNDEAYMRLVVRSIERLRAHDLVVFDEFLGFRLRRMAPL